MRTLALKVDVDTYRGTREGVPRLAKLLQQYQADATFLFSLGPDHTGRAIRRIFRPGFMQKVSRTSVVEHYGIKTLLYGTLLPGPDIARRCAGILRDIEQSGFETGIHTFDHIKWQDFVTHKNATWTEREMQKAWQRFVDVFHHAPATHGAAGWQMNDDAFVQETRWGLRYASDTRGTHPFIPVLANGQTACPQLPTTLPTLDELIGVGDIDSHNVAQHILALTNTESPTGHVYTLHAELEGMKLAPVFEQLLAGWKRQGYRLTSLATYFSEQNTQHLPRIPVIQGSLAGRSGTLALQAA